MARLRTSARAFDPIAAGWGGLVAVLGPILASGRGWGSLLLLSGVSFALGGFLAGLRAAGSRLGSAGLAAVVGLALHLLFAVLTWIASRLGGPASAPLTPDRVQGWLGLVGWGVAWTLVGGAAIDRRLGRRGQR